MFERLLRRIRVVTSLPVASGVLAACGGDVASDPGRGNGGSGAAPDAAPPDAATPDAAAPDAGLIVVEASLPTDQCNRFGAAVGYDGGTGTIDDPMVCRAIDVPVHPGLEGPVCGPGPCQVVACLPPPPAGARCAEHYGPECVRGLYGCGFSQIASEIRCELPSAAVTATPGACCYVLAGDCAIGRPFIVDGVARTAPLVAAAGWGHAHVPDVTALDVASRAALAEYWSAEALREHASVAAFSRFVLQCLALGAPAELVAAAVQASSEEIEHARVAFGLAEAYGGRACAPGALAIDGALAGSDDPRQIALAAAAEGCIAETVSALIVRAAQGATRDAAVARALARIADDEERHALLAWRFLAWLLEQDAGQLRRALEPLIDAAERHVGLGPHPTTIADGELLRAHGCLPLEERRGIARRALEHVVRPAFAALFGGRDGCLAPARPRLGAPGHDQ